MAIHTFCFLWLILKHTNKFISCLYEPLVQVLRIKWIMLLNHYFINRYITLLKQNTLVIPLIYLSCLLCMVSKTENLWSILNIRPSYRHIWISLSKKSAMHMIYLLAFQFTSVVNIKYFDCATLILKFGVTTINWLELCNCTAPILMMYCLNKDWTLWNLK